MRVGIIGGGITGLALTHALARRGVESILFEKAPRLGGVIQTRCEEGRVLELGPQRTRLVGPVRKLVEELELRDRIVQARAGSQLFIWTRERLRRVPVSLRQLATGDLLTPLGRARASLEPLTGGVRGGESVARYFRRKTGPEAYRALFGPLVSATFGSDPEHMPAERSLPMLLGPLGVRRSLLGAARRWAPDGSAVAFTFRDGMAELPRALGAAHHDRIRASSEVSGLRRSAGGLDIEFEGVASNAETVDRVVLTTPAPVAGELLRNVAPEAAERLARLRYNQVAVVPLHVDRTPEGFGFQVGFGESWRTHGVTWNASLFGRAGVATAYLGGGRDPEVADWSEDKIGATAAREFERIHGYAASPLTVARPSLPAYDDTWSALDGLELPDDVILSASYGARLGISSRIAEAESLASRLAEGQTPRISRTTAAITSGSEPGSRP